MYSLLEQINEPNDIKKIAEEDFPLLAEEIRHFLIKSVSHTGGHLASNLGVVELTMALHLFLSFPEDKLIWDVGHQSYTHKILTGRKEGFGMLRQMGGISGFPKREESDCDAFNTGHSSTSISIADGMVKARELAGGDNKVVAVIGDGALSGGMAFEALNNAGRFKSNLIIVLNDNKMSISENVGGMARYLGKLRTSKKYTGFKGGLEEVLKKSSTGYAVYQKLKRSKDSLKQLVVPGMLFENMGITYIGPIDGHNIEYMLSALEAAAQANGPVLIHVITKKGKGYVRSEKNPCKYHAVEPFDYRTGDCAFKKKETTYTEAFSKELLKLAEKDENIVAVTAAMSDGTGLTDFSVRYPNRFFDVGIAEAHAVTFAAGMAAQGYRPFVAIYSTFIQRAYDQLLHDVCANRLPVVFAIDRAGIVGKDGETHQGIFDISFLSHMPGMTLMAPGTEQEFRMMLDLAAVYNGPVAIRYPRGKTFNTSLLAEPVEFGKSSILVNDGGDFALLSVGNMLETALEVCDMLHDDGRSCSVVNARFISPIDEEMMTWIAKNHKHLVVMEENVLTGSYGEQVLAFMFRNGYKDIDALQVAIPDIFLKHGSPKMLKKSLEMDTEGIYDKIRKKWLTN